MTKESKPEMNDTMKGNDEVYILLGTQALLVVATM
tara:strand:+ start:19641 stop:19745 length:105 start_codon:yes stop_codon:yes gene_type:complete